SPPRLYQLPVLAPIGTAQRFQQTQMACHFVCLATVICCDYGQQKTGSLVGFRFPLRQERYGIASPAAEPRPPLSCLIDESTCGQQAPAALANTRGGGRATAGGSGSRRVSD